MLRKLKNIKAQSAMEFTVLITVVVAAGVAMSPYLIQSWHANMRGLELSVEESVNEDIPDPDWSGQYSGGGGGGTGKPGGPEWIESPGHGAPTEFEFYMDQIFDIY